MKRRPLSEEEKKLWQQVMQNTQPLPSGQDFFSEEEEKYPAPLPASPTRRVKPPVVKTNAELVCGGYAGIDRNTAERFRKGEMKFDGTLDLHGMSREKAHMALSSFLHAHYGKGSRCLLVVTGKGVRKEMSGESARGILREMLPVWLAEPGLQPMVLAFDVAKQKHGGLGAYYILLRRKR